jgi:hypothetical protein
MLKIRHYELIRIEREDVLVQVLDVWIASFPALARVEFMLTGNYIYEHDGWSLQLMHRLIASCEREGLESQIFRRDFSLAEM